jgi:hypothetical protein
VGFKLDPYIIRNPGPIKKKDDKEEEGDKITKESKTGCTLSPYTC